MARLARTLTAVGAAAATMLLGIGMTAPAAAAAPTFLGSVSTLTTIASTVPANGDVNPYGVAVVPQSVGRLHSGSVLVSNFNAATNQQGTGSTLVQITPDGKATLFAQVDATQLPGPCPGGVGLTTALAVLKSGWVIVGSLPTSDGTAATAKAGCLLVLDAAGKVRETITNQWINGPWDMTAADHGRTADLFLTNVLNGTVAAKGGTVNRGTVLRIRLTLPEDGDGHQDQNGDSQDQDHQGKAPVASRPVVIGSGFAEHTDPAALVVGPTGVALSRSGDTLYVADTAGNRITAIPDASTRTNTAFTGAKVTSGGSLNSPLGLTVIPNGHLLSVNAGDGLAVETTPEGKQVATLSLDSTGIPPGSGALFGLAPAPDRHGVYYVDDVTNTLNLLH
jgi:hypothetical protein